MRRTQLDKNGKNSGKNDGIVHLRIVTHSLIVIKVSLLVVPRYF